MGVWLWQTGMILTCKKFLADFEHTTLFYAVPYCSPVVLPLQLLVLAGGAFPVWIGRMKKALPALFSYNSPVGQILHPCLLARLISLAHGTCNLAFACLRVVKGRWQEQANYRSRSCRRLSFVAHCLPGSNHKGWGWQIKTGKK